MASQWRLVRNCSLSPRQTLWAWSVPVAASAFTALLFLLLGYPLVTLFCILEMLAIGVALCVYARHARDGDTLRLDESGLLYIHSERGGRCRTLAWRASCVRMSLD